MRGLPDWANEISVIKLLGSHKTAQPMWPISRFPCRFLYTARA